MIVALFLDDIDRHGECYCGDCNSNGKSYGVGIFKITELEHVGSVHVDSVREDDPLERVYGPSEEAAFQNARDTCDENGWKEASPSER